MKLVALRKADQNAALTDPWTVVHLGSGLACGLTALPFWPVFGLAVGYEVVEHFVERLPAGQRFFKSSEPESFPNAVVDVVTFALGWWLGARYNRS